MRFGVVLTPDGTLPAKAHDDDACFDVHAATSVTIVPGASKEVRLGFTINLEPGWCARIYPRSGMGSKGLRLANCVGVIDAGYRGEVRAVLHNDSCETVWRVNVGDRVAQMEIARVEDVGLYVTEAVTATVRGSGGFGSTGT